MSIRNISHSGIARTGTFFLALVLTLMPAPGQAAAAEEDSSSNEPLPSVTGISLVAPDILELTIEAQKIVPAKFEKYVPAPGDRKQVEKYRDGRVRRAVLVRGGKKIGWLQGPRLEWFSTFEGIEGVPLDETGMESPGNFRISSKEDAAYSGPTAPVAVYRKSLPTDWQLGGEGFPLRHKLYLKLPGNLTPTATYQIAISNLNLQDATLTFRNSPRTTRSDAVHVNQIGYRPDDPGKQALLSTWLGTGGPLTYDAAPRFTIIDEKSGADVFSGTATLRSRADDEEKLGNHPFQNSALTAVYEMDFSGLRKPGRYRVYAEGIGCSYPFEIGADVWKHAFIVQLRGLFNNRSGVELGPPYTTFHKPRDFHPEDGALITRTTYDPLTRGDDHFPSIVKNDTGEAAANAWGGYHDAGDWNPRRASHLAVTMAQLEVMELFPDFCRQVKLNIPPTPGVPDILTEAMFEIDCFRRMQQPDGGVPYGIETNGDPEPGEVSWLSSAHAYVLAPNMRDTWHYAAAAARLSRVLKPFDARLASEYLESARKAFDWAEKDYAARKEAGRMRYKELWRALDNRNFAALLLYDITGEKSYHDIFAENTCLKNQYTGLYWWGKFLQSDAAFFYARMDDAKTDPQLKKTAIAAILRTAEASLAYQQKNAFSITSGDIHRPVFGGYFSVSGGTELAHAHYLTGDQKYLEGAVRSCQFQLGANPSNIVYTTGLGSNPIRNPLHLDSRSTGQAAPEGLTSFGNVDYWNNKGEFWTWPVAVIAKPGRCFPDPYEWPLSEAYFDIFLFVGINEFVVDTWAPNIAVWGYLAARGAAEKKAR